MEMLNETSGNDWESFWGFLEAPAEGGDLVSMVTSVNVYLSSSCRPGNLST